MGEFVPQSCPLRKNFEVPDDSPFIEAMLYCRTWDTSVLIPRLSAPLEQPLDKLVRIPQPGHVAMIHTRPLQVRESSVGDRDTVEGKPNSFYEVLPMGTTMWNSDKFDSLVDANPVISSRVFDSSVIQMDSLISTDNSSC